jgi:hypothetical protein
MKHLLPFFVFLFPVCLFANEPQWKAFVQEDTVLVGHINLTKIDVAQIIQNSKPIADAIPPDSLPLVEGGQKYLTETLGIKEVFIVANLRMFPPQAVIILPKTEKTNTDMIQELTDQYGFTMVNRKDSKYVLIIPKRSWTVSDADSYFNQNIPATLVDRPDIAEAFQAVENAPIKLVMAMPEFARKVIKETRPQLPSPFDKLDIVTPLSGLRWAAIGIEPATSVMNVTAAMTSELAAQNTLQSLQEAVPLILDGVPTSFSIFGSGLLSVSQPEFKETLLKNQDRIRALVIPKVEGKNLTVRWEKPQFEEMFNLASPFLKELTTNEHDRIKRQPCSTQIRILLLSLHTHHDSQGKFPPPFTVDAKGKPLHSWRVLVLPYIEQYELYKKIRLDEPWDSTHNKQFHDQMPTMFRCPACTLGDPKRDTVYCMVVGEETIGVPNGKGISWDKITDGTSNTIALVERKTPVCWMEPVDVLQEHAYLGVNKHELGIGSEHLGGVIAGLCDGSVYFMKEDIDHKWLKALLTKAGGENVPRDELLELFR